MRRLFVSGIILLSLFLLSSSLPSQTYAASQDQKCFKILRYTFCIPLPPKPPPFPTIPPRPPIRFRPTITPTPTPNIECSASTVCGNVCLYGGVTYNTVLIGNQCWFKNNLNAGTMITNFEIPDNTPPTINDPNTVQKWCFNDILSNCSNEGGLYTWSETNALSDSCNYGPCNVPNNQGICPNGWHIPTDAEFYTLENYLKTPGQTCDATRNAWDCSDAGTKLRIGGSSGFDAISAGNHETNGDQSFFDKREPSIHFWLSSPPNPNIAHGTYAWLRTLGYGGGSDGSMVARGSYLKKFGLSIRCLANTVNTP